LDRLWGVVLLNYQEVRYLDLSGNSLVDIQVLSELRNLHTLNVAKNQINSFSAFSPCVDDQILPFLQFLNLSGNKIQRLENLENLRSLRKL
jgi:Leucine-rich repeat (LRR) protein